MDSHKLRGRPTEERLHSQSTPLSNSSNSWQVRNQSKLLVRTTLCKIMAPIGSVSGGWLTNDPREKISRKTKVTTDSKPCQMIALWHKDVAREINPANVSLGCLRKPAIRLQIQFSHTLKALAVELVQSKLQHECRSTGTTRL